MFRVMLRAFARLNGQAQETRPLGPILCTNAGTAPDPFGSPAGGYSYWLAPSGLDSASAGGFPAMVVDGRCDAR